MSIDLISIEDIAALKPIECPSRGKINFPCAICKACEIGESEMEFGDGFLMEKTVNSILVHVLLDARDEPLEKLALQFFKKSLSAIVPFVQRGDWEEGDVTILITDDMNDKVDTLHNISQFIRDMPRRWRSISIEAKRAMTKWADNNAKQVAHQVFKELR